MEKDNKFYIKIGLLTIGLLIALILIFILIPLNRSKEITINATPKDTRFKIGKNEGSTPCKVKLKPGRYKIELTMKGYDTLTVDLEVKPFGKSPSFNYSLKKTPSPPPNPKKVRETNFGSLPVDPHPEASLKKLKEKYPFYNELPYNGNYFIIMKPSRDEEFYVYVAKDDADYGKQLTYDWFLRKGTMYPKDLKIRWLKR